jgi:FKBP-type peptidyl-prolyl cis-trans isomerase (trigger factor)
MISNLIINEVAKEEKIEIDQAEIDAYKIEIYANIGGEENLPNVLVSASIPSTSLDNVLRRDLILRKITDGAIASGVSEAEVNDLLQKIVTDKAAALSVEVNPRYGTWDATSLTVVAKEPAGDAVNDK